MYNIDDEERLKISRSGLLARSPEGHAAKGMPIKGHEDMWVEIQAHTFKNWVNENLKDSGYQVTDLTTDLCDGVRLVALVSALQKKRLRYVKRPLNQHQSLENVTTALKAITDDGIRLVNIGNVDIVNGNIKLILGLIWSLIVHYQFGSSKFPPKKMMLAWLKNVLPECSIHNFTSDWNSGVALSALLDYCKPGLFPNWRDLDPKDRIQNCERSMQLAQQVFNIPMVLEPEYLASPYLDELSGMTYLSYFMKELSPGYFATLKWVQFQVPEVGVQNFTTDWNDGIAVCSIVKSFGGPVPGFKDLSKHPAHWENNQHLGVNGGLRLGVEPVLRAVDMADPEVEHLGVMAYAAGFQWLKKKPPPAERLVVNIDAKRAKVNQPTTFRIDFIYPEDVDPSQIRVEIQGPKGSVPCELDVGPDGGIGTFIPTHVGMHELRVFNEDELVKGCPQRIRAVPDSSGKIMFAGLDPCAVGSVVEVSINSNGAGDGDLRVIAEAPSGRELPCSANRDGNAFVTTFKPDEAGQWSIAVYYDDEHIQGSPFSCVVYDPNAVKLSRLEGAMPGEPFTFSCDTIEAGIGEVRFDIVYRGKSVPHELVEIRPGIYRVTFTPPEVGKYRIYTYFNGNEVKGSPFKMRATVDGKPVPESRSTRTLERVKNSVEPKKIEKLPSVPVNASHLDEFKENRFNSVDRIKRPSPAPQEVNGHDEMSSSLLSSQATRGIMSIQNFELLKSVKEVNRVNKSFHNTRESRDENDAVHARLVTMRDLNVEGRGLQLSAVDRLTTFTIESPGVRAEDLDVRISGPKGTVVKPHVYDGPRMDTITVEFSCSKIGEYLIELMCQGQPIRNSPFRCFAYNSQEIRVGDIPDGVLGEPVEFEIDGSSAGSGNLEILVNGGHVTSSVSSLGGQKFLASFVPHQASLHTIEMKFNDDPVPGSPWTIMVVEPTLSSGRRPSVIGDGVRHIPSRRQASVQLALATNQSVGDVKATVTGPNKRTISHTIVNLYNGTCEVEFTPTEVGAYVVDAMAGNLKVYGCPIIAKAYDAGLIRVSEVTTGVVGQLCQFRVDASSAGEGQLEISINDGEVPNQVQVLGGGRCLVSFTPDHPRLHTIDIKFNGETVPGCPFTCKVTDTSRVSVSLRNLELIAVGEPAKFDIAVDSSSNAELAVAVRGPSTDPPVRVSGNTQTGLVAEFTPVEVGPHTVTVELNGVHVSGSPAVCKAYDSRKVIASPVPRGTIGKQVQFTVDAGGCGEGNLEITISARGRNVPTQVQPQGSARFTVSFVPLEAVDHVVSITFNKESVPGSPFTCSISNDPGRVTASGRSLASASVLRTSTFHLTNVSGSVEDIEVNIEGPNGLSVPAQVKDNTDGTCSVDFTPKIVGEHRIFIAYRGRSLPGSPFVCKVYDASAIQVSNPAEGVVDKPVTVIVETSQAGPGNLEVTVNGGQIPTSAQAQGLHSYAISFLPKEAKIHEVELKFNGESVPGSPFLCKILDARQCTVSGDGIEKVPVGRQSTFFVDLVKGPEAAIDVAVIGPSRHVVANTVQQLNETKYMVEYVAQEVGDHSVSVKYGSIPIQGSPFLVKAYDATRVHVSDVETGVVGKPFFFTIDAGQAGAGNLEIIVSVNGKHLPNYVQSEGNARFRVSFRPQEAALHLLSVRFNGEPVPGSPFNCPINESSQIIVSGPALKLSSIQTPARLVIEAKGTEIGDLIVTVLSPSDQNVPVNISGSKSEKTVAEFQPFEVGPHSVAVTLDHEPLPGSPFTCNVYDVIKVLVTGLGPTKVNTPVTFTVDASQAGEGTLELVVTTAKGSVKADVKAVSRGLYDVTFLPVECLSHFVNITFNDEDVKGNPFRCEVSDHSAQEKKLIHRTESKLVTASGQGLKEVARASPAIFEVDKKGKDGNIEVRIKDSHGDLVPCKTSSHRGSLVRVEYRPDVIGTYAIEILHDGKPIYPKPLQVEVTDPSALRVIHVDDAVAGKESGFTVDTSEAGKGTLSVSVAAGGRDVKHSVQGLGGGQLKVVFHPQLPVPHKVNLKYSDVSAAGCPFEIPVRNPWSGKDITAHGLGLYQARTGRPTSFAVETKGNVSKLFDVVVTGPGETAVPVRCYQQKDGNLLVEFNPQTPGIYKVDVLYDGRPVRGSPYSCDAYDPTLVSFTGWPKDGSIAVSETVEIKLNRIRSGIAEMEVLLSGPTGRDISLDIKQASGQDATSFVEFTPTLAGRYKFNITYGGEEIPGSPLILNVEDEGTVKVSGDGLSLAIVGEESSLLIEAGGLSGEPSVQIDGPDSVAKSSVISQGNGKYIATYLPQEVGIFNIRVLWNGKEVIGSPFHPRVVDPTQIRVIGELEQSTDGHMLLAVGEEHKISFDTTDAGPGKLTSRVEGPTHEIHISVEQPLPNRAKLRFTPQEAGLHRVYIYWQNLPIFNSPLTAFSTLPEEDEDNRIASPEHVRVILTGKGLASALCGERAEFTIDGSLAGKGSPEVSIIGTKMDIPVQLTPIGSNRFRATYLPENSGVYLLNVMWGDRQVRGCPLKVKVTSLCDASEVLCTSDGLKGAMLGQSAKVFIDTRKAGSGELTAHCAGPKLPALCELTDHGEGTFTLSIQPQEAGKHFLTVKFGGEHVGGSPFPIKVLGAPDPTKVRVYGPGIEHGVLALFQSRFICDTRGAGVGQLTVKIRGPKGAFRVEMQRETQSDRIILCKYDPTEPGDYRIEVKWAGQHVTGSPFSVMIFDTQEELSRYIQGGQVAKQDPMQYGSIGYKNIYGPVQKKHPRGPPSWKGSNPRL